jgi:DNA polymerase III epsilon subunit family exonuclease
MENKVNENFVVVDIETTGLSKQRDMITEFCGVKVEFDGFKFKEIERFNTLINPCKKIPHFITKLTGIDNNMVKDSPTFDEVSDEIKNFISNDIFVGHNVMFDYNFLNHKFYLKNFESIENNNICTCKLSRRVFPGLASYKLGSVCQHLGIVNISEHRALGDVLATTNVFERIYNNLKKINISKTEEILRFQKRKICDCYKY